MSRNAKMVQDAPFQEPIDTVKSPGWLDWFVQMTRAVNRQMNRGWYAVTPGPSPWVYQADYSGDSRMVLSGGTISALAISKDGSAYLPINPATGVIQMSQGEFVQVTYSSAPTVNIISN